MYVVFLRCSRLLLLRLLLLALRQRLLLLLLLLFLLLLLLLQLLLLIRLLLPPLLLLLLLLFLLPITTVTPAPAAATAATATATLLLLATCLNLIDPQDHPPTCPSSLWSIEGNFAEIRVESYALEQEMLSQRFFFQLGGPREKETGQTHTPTNASWWC